MKAVLLTISIIILLLFLLGGCIQEKLLFYPDKLPADHKYNFPTKFEELNFETAKNVKINALHFKAESSKGVVLYFHGNAGALDSWGNVAPAFLKSNYDLLIIDYRGFGKSTGKMSEKGLFHDAQFIYDKLKDQYTENKIIVYGRSIGTGIAAHIAANNSPYKLILETPYYNLKDLVKNIYPAAPRFILRYRLKTNEYLPEVKCPVYLFHGTADEVIYYGSSQKLQPLLKPGDSLITVPGGRHNDLSGYEEYRKGLEQILEK
jgi:alpha-beta hydrolase superfamily lysophospholipase